MAYNTLYYFEFDDTVHPTSAHWRVQIDSNVYTGVPIPLPYMDENPLTITRSSESESKLSVFVGSKATIRYVYDGTSNTPHPRIFKDIQEDTLMVSIFKNGVLNFRGFVKPDGGQYPLNVAPITYEINATDYINGFKNKNIDIGNTSAIFYGYFNLVSFINRTLFNAAPYDGVSLKVWNRIVPNVVGSLSGVKWNWLYMHSDIFYDYDSGADSIYDSLEKFLLSFRARLIFSAGTYWIQRISDTYGGADTIDVITPSTTSVISAANSDLFFTFTSQPSSQFNYVEDSANVRITPAVFTQKSTYELKAINKLNNFLWQDVITDFSDVNFGRPIGWNPSNVVAVGSVTRGGTGTLDDPYVMRVSGSTSGYNGYLTQTINGVKAGQYVQVDVKAGIYWSTGQRIHVILTPVAGPGTKQYYMDGSGAWSDNPNNELLVSGDKKTRLGSLSVTSKTIPDAGTTYALAFWFRFVEAASDPEDPVPSGEVVHNFIYPPFLRIFSNLIASVETTTRNSKNYTNIPGDETPTFIDMADSNLSNCIFYSSDGSTFTPVPFTNWRDADLTTSKSLDNWSGLTVIDDFNVPSNVLEADVISNSLEFHHTLIIPDIDDGIRAIQLSDTYDVKDGKHSIVAEQVFEKGSGTGTYTLKSIPK